MSSGQALREPVWWSTCASVSEWRALTDVACAAGSLQVAGLDVGWGQQLPMEPDTRYPHRFVLRRELPPGQYQFKFVIVSGRQLRGSCGTRLLAARKARHRTPRAGNHDGLGAGKVACVLAVRLLCLRA